MPRSLWKPWWSFRRGPGDARVEMFDTMDEAILKSEDRPGTLFIFRTSVRPHEPNASQVFTADGWIEVTDDLRLEALARMAQAEEEAELKKLKVKEKL